MLTFGPPSSEPESIPGEDGALEAGDEVAGSPLDAANEDDGVAFAALPSDRDPDDDRADPTLPMLETRGEEDPDECEADLVTSEPGSESNSADTRSDALGGTESGESKLEVSDSELLSASSDNDVKVAWRLCLQRRSTMPATCSASVGPSAWAMEGCGQAAEAFR